MTLTERRKKLMTAERMLKMTTKRIRRLITAQANWAKRVNYHSALLKQEEAAVAAIPIPVKRDRMLLPTITGRKFRD